MAGDEFRDSTAAASYQMGSAPVRRDDLGFVTSAQANLSLAQVSWLLSFSTYGDNARACDDAGVDPDDVGVWLSDSRFRNILDNMLENKREGVKQIGQQLLPLMLLELTKIMQFGNNKEKLTAIKLHANMQGMLIAQNAIVDRSALETLREQLMQPRPVIRTLPSGTSTES